MTSRGTDKSEAINKDKVGLPGGNRDGNVAADQTAAETWNNIFRNDENSTNSKDCIDAELFWKYHNTSHRTT
jgi:hypothetical protein